MNNISRQISILRRLQSSFRRLASNDSGEKKFKINNVECCSLNWVEMIISSPLRIKINLKEPPENLNIIYFQDGYQMSIQQFLSIAVYELLAG